MYEITVITNQKELESIIAIEIEEKAIAINVSGIGQAYKITKVINLLSYL